MERVYLCQDMYVCMYVVFPSSIANVSACFAAARLHCLPASRNFRFEPICGGASEGDPQIA